MKLKSLRISVVVRNTIANYAGNILTALIAFIFIPIYIRYLGIGSYGIIGFFASLQAVLAFLDLGIGIALNREMSRYYHDKTKVEYLRNLSHSLQVVYWGIAILVGVVLFSLSPLLAANWFKGNEIPEVTLYSAFAILSLTLAVRWPYSLYSSGIRGMQHQVVLNGNDLFWGLMKSFGSWLVLKYFSPTLPAFLWYQCLITFLQTVSTYLLLWHYMPKATNIGRRVFDIQTLRNIGRYAAGMGVAYLLSSIILQLDKILVSKMVSPSQFGYYMLATNVASLVYNASLPMYMSIFPHFAKLAHENDKERIKKDFHFYSNLLSSILFPFSAIVFFAAEEILWLWTKDKALAYATAPILQIMIVGVTLNALLTTVHTLLLAYNRVRFMLYSNIIGCALMIPLTLLLVHFFGVTGGAWSISILYSAYFFIQGTLIFRNLGFKDLILNWYIRDTFKIWLPVSLIVFTGSRYWLPPVAEWTKSGLLIKFSIIMLFAYIVAFLFNDSVRKKIFSRLQQRKKVLY